MKRRLFIFMTGQYRQFWHSWNNLVENVLRPAEPFFDVYVCVGMDKKMKYKGVVWFDLDRQVFETHLRSEWLLLNYPAERLMLEWIESANEPYFLQAMSSLQNYRDNGKLDQYWYDYLIFRSGSCIEYAQMARLYDLVCSQYKMNDDDLMMRTRTDILFRHPLHIDSLPIDKTSSTKDIFQSLFPSSPHFDNFAEISGREYSIFPPEFTPGQWVITMRKNLIYIMPLKTGALLLEIAKRYGDWDVHEMNHYWFNAESQFRGCFRHHNLYVWEYSQDRDECYGGFENQPEDFPIYAIYR